MGYKVKKLSFMERLYFPPIIEGLLTTMKHFFSKKVTMQYPEEKWKVPKGYRGLPKLVMGDDGVERCVACKLCEWVCPVQCITIDIGEYPNPDIRERVPKEFTIDLGKCIVCGFCVEACPVDAIVMSEEHEFSRYNRDELIFPKKMLLADYKEMIKKYGEHK
jgi:NADH-quinone oxidoreductase subunit I